MKPIAIISMGCRFPGGADNPARLWDLLRDGVDAIVDVPADRWSSPRFYDPNPDMPGKTYLRKGGFLQASLAEFDAAFFGITPREAAFVDPQARLMLEITWEALESAGIAPGRLGGTRTGVFFGSFALDYLCSQMSPYNRYEVNSHAATGSTLAILANRISYFYGFQGPSIALDTACSSSLVATHLACQSLWNGECTMALAGGVNTMLRPEYAIVMSQARFLAPDGRCKAFDESANGYSRGEGAGVVVLKLLDDAIAAGDPIEALILATAVNQDGRTPGIAVPNAAAQEALLREAYARAGVAAAKVGLVEAHGTGTAVGDPIEASAIGKVVSEGRAGQPCWLGSIKTNLGHLEAAAGVAGLIKAVLCLKHRQIPPHLHLKNPNPKIAFDELNLRLARQLECWDQSEGPRLASVNSFGYGGTNAHAVLQEAPPVGASEGSVAVTGDNEGPMPQILPLSTRSEEALQALVRAYLDSPSVAEASLRDLCYSAARRDSRLDQRLAFVAGSPAELQEAMLAYLGGEPSPNVLRAPRGHASAERSKPVFVYTGMGPQWWAMGRELMATEPVFRAEVEAIDTLFRELTDEWRLIDELLKPEAESRLTRTALAQASNFAVQAGLTRLLASWDLAPAAVVGHSVGEVAAAYAAGCLSRAEAARVSFHRGRAQATATGGKMLATDLTAAQAEELLAGYGERAVVAAINSPQSLTLAGDPDALGEIAARLAGSNRFNRFLQVEVAYHSPHMNVLREGLLKSLDGLHPRPASVPLYSSVTGQRTDGSQWNAAYWWRNVRETVSFAAAIESLTRDGHDLFIEIGPHPVLGTSIGQTLRGLQKTGNIVASLHRKKGDRFALAEMLGRLYSLGYGVDWRHRHPGGGKLVALPTYPWQRETHWSESAASRADRLGTDAPPFIVDKAEVPALTRQVELSPAAFPYLADHRIEGSTVFPGAGYIEAALELGLSTAEGRAQGSLGGDAGAELENLELHKPLVMPADEAAPLLNTTFHESTGTFTLHSRRPADDGAWTLHASGRFVALRSTDAPLFPVEEVHQRCPREVDVTALYASLKERGLEYGPCFQGIQALWLGNEEVLARIDRPAACPADGASYRLHPVLLDAAFQSLAALLDGDGSALCLPAGFERVQWLAPTTGPLWVHGRVNQRGAKSVLGDLTLCDEKWRVCARVKNLRYQYVAQDAGRAERARRWQYEFTWQLSDGVPIAESVPAPLLILGDQGGFGRALAALSESVLIEPTALATLPDRLAEAGPLSRFRHVVYLGGLDAPSLDTGSPESTTRAGAALLELAGRLAECDGAKPRLWIVTRGAQSVPGDSARAVAQSSLWGIGRVIAAEIPDLQCTLVDGDPADFPATALIAELASPTGESEIAIRNSARYLRRMRRFDPDALPPVVKSGETPPFQLEVGRRGSFDSLHFRERAGARPGAGEVRLRVEAVGLNFKDVLKTMGVLSDRVVQDTMSGETLGLECSGTVIEVGEGVTRLKAGDGVLTFAAGCFQSHLNVPADWAFPMLPGLSFEQEASLPVVFLTAYYALNEIGRLQKGERCLIHAATGGVGLAAIQVARYLGAEVFATAGSPAKRDYLKSLGIAHVMDSRRLDFADEVMALTGGGGVDVVLNSLSGEALRKSFSILAPYGRFLEIGKRDIDEDNALGLRPFQRNLTFSSIDIDRLIAQRPPVAVRLMTEVRELFAREVFHPLPVEVFPATRIADAFRHLAQAKHIGKVVLKLGDESVGSKRDVVGASDAGQEKNNWPASEAIAVAPARPEPLRLSEDATYLVTGGLGGAGLELASFLADRGARHLYLVGRSGATRPEAAAAVESLRAREIDVIVKAADVSDRVHVSALLEEIAGTGYPLRGVYHAAMVLDDAPLTQLTEARYRRVLEPKAFGAWHLHQLTRDLPLDHFVLFSSVVAELGNPGQASYAAANAFLDALAHARRLQGLPALSLNWGALAGAGVVARNERLNQHLARQGWTGLPLREAFEVMAQLLVGNQTQVAVADINWAAWKRAYPAIAGSPRFTELVQAADSADTEVAEASWRETLSALPADQRQPQAEKLVGGAVARVLGFDAEKLDLHRGLDLMGVDSLMAVELQHVLQAHSGVELSSMDLMRGPTCAQLAQLILSRFAPAEG